MPPVDLFHLLFSAWRKLATYLFVLCVVPFLFALFLCLSVYVRLCDSATFVNTSSSRGVSVLISTLQVDKTM